jgi:hypothetical protein
MRTLVAAAFVLSVGLSFSCNRAVPKEEAPSLDPLNRVENAPKLASLNLVRNTFPVSRYTKFEFEVPAHSPTPKLEGTFAASGKKGEGEVGDDTKIDFLVMTADEFELFAKGRGGTATYSVTDAHSQTVEYALPSTLDSAQKYYLVFRNPAPKVHAVSVTADLSVSF